MVTADLLQHTKLTAFLLALYLSVYNDFSDGSLDCIISSLRGVVDPTITFELGKFPKL